MMVVTSWDVDKVQRCDVSGKERQKAGRVVLLEWHGRNKEEERTAILVS